MATLNKVLIIGNLGRDPEVRYMANGDAVCNFSVATTETWKDKNGEQQEKTEWHRVSFFGKIAEVAGKYLKKGSSVYVEGKIETRKYEKDGVEKFSTEIRGQAMQFLGGKFTEAAEEGARETKTQATDKAEDYDLEDMPF